MQTYEKGMFANAFEYIMYYDVYSEYPNVKPFKWYRNTCFPILLGDTSASL